LDNNFREDWAEVQKICHENLCMFSIASDFEEDRYFVYEWRVAGPRGWSNAAGAYTNVEDALQSCLNWLRSRMGDG
jgi:hypothetical protein